MPSPSPAFSNSDDLASPGFYTPDLGNADLDALNDALKSGIRSEIDVLRLTLRWMLRLAADIETLEIGLKYIATLGIASARLASLLRTQSVLHLGSEDEFMRELQDALSEVHDELFHD